MVKFSEIGLRKELIQAITELEFETPTPIQEKGIPFVLKSQSDLIAIAQTGTGKTAAFSLPIIEQIKPDDQTVQSIIICPTRELCMQITKDIKNFIKFLPEIKVIPIYGGTRIENQIQGLRKGRQIVVGTPGRVLDLIKRKKLKINNIRWLVIDEADEILNMGFKEELDAILAETPKDKQTLLFSATMPNMVKKIAQKYMRQAEEIRIHKKNTALANIKHFYYMVHAKDRYKALRRIADVNPDIYGIIFCRTRIETQEIADKLIQDHYPAEALHGDMSQEMRDQTMNRFRKKQIQLLVATDIAARGIDVNDLTHIISYNLPDSLETYIHRSGRTGRAKKRGISISIIHLKEMHKIQILERKVGQSFERKQIPLGKEICEKQLFHIINKIAETEIEKAEIEKYAPFYEKLNKLTKKDLIQRLVAIEFNKFLSFYKDSPDLNVAVTSGNRVNHNRNVKFAQFKINMGNNQNFGPKRLIETLIKKPALKYVKIGQIDIRKNESLFEIDANYTNDLLEAFQKSHFKGYSITVTPTPPFTKQGGFERRKSQNRRLNNYQEKDNYIIGRKIRRKR